MRLIKLMTLPLVIASLITGSASLNAKMSGMIALRTILYFLVTSLLASLVGLIWVLIIHPGDSSIKTMLGDGKLSFKCGVALLYWICKAIPWARRPTSWTPSWTLAGTWYRTISSRPPSSR